jgi:oligoendopeptidase F
MASTVQLPRREEIPLDRTWNKADVYPSDEAWEEALVAASAEVPTLERFRGRAGASAEALLEALRSRDQWYARVWHLRWYAAMSVKTNAADTVAAERHQRAMALISHVDAALAYIDPELAVIDEEQFDAFCRQEPALDLYSHALAKLRRRSAHVGTPEVEAVIASAGDLAGSSYETYKVLVNGELRFGTVGSADGQQVEVNQGTIYGLSGQPERSVRAAAWAAYADAYLALRQTLAGLLGAAFRRDVFLARARGYPTALDASLDAALLPRPVFDNLLEASTRHLPLWHRFFGLKRRALGVDSLRGYDLGAPLVSAPRVIPYDDARHLLLASVAPLGEEYTGILKRGLYAERWVDWAGNQGKAGGAEQSGAYGLHPFVLITYADDLLSVSVLAHELGHAMHSYYCDRAQPPAYDSGHFADYLSETASTFGQALLRAYLLQANAGDPLWQLEVLDEAFTYFHRYLLQMPLLARLEMEGHQRIERGQGMSADWLSERTLELFSEGYGPAVTLDPARDGILWAQFPHLYLNFYTYQYALGIAAATALAEAVGRDGEPAAARYRTFLSAGDSIFPLDAWRLAGVDMASPEPLERVYAVLAEMVDRLEAAIDSRPAT